MSFAFDLGSYEDVRANAEEIYERLADGSMPCDARWPGEEVAARSPGRYSARFRAQSSTTPIAPYSWSRARPATRAPIAGPLGVRPILF
jgi:hypothetical protein